MIRTQDDLAADPGAAFESVRPLLLHTACRFRRRNGGDLDELLGQARLHYVHAYRSWRPGRGAGFASWVRLKVWRGLQEDRRRERLKCRQPPPPRASRAPGEVPDRKRYWTHAFLADLSGDAREVSEILFTLPDRAGDNRQTVRARLLAALHEKGWAGEHIVAILREISEALTP